MGNRLSSVPRPLQVISNAVHTIFAKLISAAWELTEEEFLNGVPLSVLINQTATALANLSLASIPPPAPGTSEDCLFLDVFVPKSIFDRNSTTKSKHNGGGEFSYLGNLPGC
jgi:hypothetical protein